MVHFYDSYLVISPNPQREGSCLQERIFDHTSQQWRDAKCFYIKFGDADDADERERAYKTHNPSYAFQKNSRSLNQTLEYIDMDRRRIYPKIGKYLEWTAIRLAGGTYFYEGTEWHRLVLREGQDIETLRRILCELLALFPQYDWQHEPRSAAVRRFEEKVQEAWWGPNGIAEFHD
ncbi:hypothetical protein BU26DRAFT_516807 [Trematosphaeria pertusa]|uniref:Uncharacterized protein n=1 Tax=Trematosphaeria pertusa TaxID=390896 RepID=A0A6A6IR96_9PLEO|nr:uncharacterized protein BU26DRAFT_516807 [Trematosphaeria pertusa]KAF2252110.1 hypothetical protein BU26DRAFT_516807 [Trematosphaeria pertusa]